ncbi:MAG: undecaprenyl-diphosphate phosphatase [Bacteroidetes bacterium]|nr:MAG: undecaprenyl-diphosphate phosphatase [Bacteroidota bacterium]
MNILESIILGIVQGLTEFLPVSSSGHIELGKALMGAQDVGIDFTILVHVATALSSVIVFRKDIVQIFAGLLEFRNNQALQYTLKLLVSAIPVAIVGLLFKDQVETLFGGNIILVGSMLLVTALLLFLTTRVQSEGKSINYVHAIIIGLAQMCAILPGISRSGATIATALLMNIDKEKAAKFSFLMVLIPIFGEALLDAKNVLEDPGLWSLSADITIAGFLASFFSGLFACTIMLRIVKQGKLYYFSIYCAIVGLLAIALGLF